MADLTDRFGTMVFSEEVMKDYLPKDIWKRLAATLEDGEPLDLDVANAVAHAMKVCSASGGFIARYGGDEFVVLQKAAADQDIIRLCASINDELARAEVPYLLRMSIGYARVGDGVDTWQDLLRAADAELYRVKREKKKAGAQIR